MQRTLCFYGNPILRVKGSKIKIFNDDLKIIIKDMIETMHEQNGIGLAAQQIGLAKQICVVDLDCYKNRDIDFNYSYDGKPLPLELFMPLALINPDIQIINKDLYVREEGCLSFPNILGMVKRPTSIICKFQDVSGNMHCLEADGLLARCILHEIDHLNGVLFIDKMQKSDLHKNKKKINQLKRKYKG